MQVFLVGGAVRDRLLGRAVHDADYVVVGSTPQHMLEEGFIQVGADFPVFLHPATKQEYALARTERKSGQGYTGFAIHASADVTLEEDLIRRDLTINAMAIEVNGLYDDTPKTGEVIAPYGGLEDIENRILRHVSPAFAEDPLRVLRVARFYARYAKIDSPLDNKAHGNDEDNASVDNKHGFSIAEETFNLMQKMVAQGELKHLSRERIWVESQRATLGQNPHLYWQTLYDLGALSLFEPLQTHWRDNISAKHTTLKALSLSAKFNLSIEQRWAVLMASFGCDDINGNESINSIHSNNTIPKKIAHFAKSYAENSQQLSMIHSLSAEDLMNLLQNTKSHKQPESLTNLLTVHQVIQSAKATLLIDTAFASYQAISMADIDPSLRGKDIGEALQHARVRELKDMLDIKKK